MSLFSLNPNPPNDFIGLTAVNEKFNEWGWHISPEVQLFAGDGGGDHFGIWLPETESKIFDHPIIEIGQIFEPGCMGVVGTNLTSFLLGRTVWSLLLDKLQVPQRIRSFKPFGNDTERQYLEIIKWADPLLPDSLLSDIPYSSYRQEYTVTDLKKLFGDP